MKNGGNQMNCNKRIKVLSAFALTITILVCSATASIADTIYDCSYLFDVGNKAYKDTDFYKLCSSVSGFDDLTPENGAMYFVALQGIIGSVEYIDFGNQDKCHQWITFEDDPVRICLDCYDTFVDSIVMVVDPSGEVYAYSNITDNYAEFLASMNK